MMIENANVYGIENAIRGSKLPMAVDASKPNAKQTYYILIEANRTWSPKAEGRWPDVCKGCMNKVLARISNIVAEEVQHD